MFLREQIEAAKALFLSIHDHRYDFLYQISIESKDWSSSGWKTVTEGFNTKTQKTFPQQLTDSAIIDVVSGKNTSIHSGFKRIQKVKYLACRFGKYTRYFAIDIDNKQNNEYYNIETINKILEITKSIGIPLLMQSSYSKGWHLRWYFTEPVKTWDIAVYIQDLFAKNGFVISPSKFEVFPNKKSEPHALYQGLRLPCQKGSALLSLDDGRVLATHDEDPEVFFVHWAEEVCKSLIDSTKLAPIISSEFKSYKSKAWSNEYKKLKEEGFTGHSQTNPNLKQMAKGFIVFEGITDVQEITKRLCKWIDDKNNGWSEEYNNDPKLAYDWCKRWAICALKKYKPLNSLIKNKKRNNSKSALSAQHEHILKKHLEEGLITLDMSPRKIEQLTGISKSVVHRKLNALKIQKNFLITVP